MNNKEIARLRTLQNRALELEQYAKIKDKERELKTRITDAKKDIRGVTWLDKLMNVGRPKEMSGKERANYSSIFSEPLQEQNLEIIPPSKPKPTGSVKRRKSKSRKKAVKKVMKDKEPLDILEEAEQANDFILDDDTMRGLI